MNNNDVLFTLDSLAAISRTSGGLEGFIDALLDSVGASFWEHHARLQLRNVLLDGGLAPAAAMQPKQFLESLCIILEHLKIKRIFTVSDSDLFAARKVLSNVMPNFFRDPTVHTGILPSERVYLLYLLWLSGTWTRRTDPISTPHGANPTVLVIGGLAPFISSRDNSLSTKSALELRRAFGDLCSLVAYRSKEGAV